MSAEAAKEIEQLGETIKGKDFDAAMAAADRLATMKWAKLCPEETYYSKFAGTNLEKAAPGILEARKPLNKIDLQTIIDEPEPAKDEAGADEEAVKAEAPAVVGELGLAEAKRRYKIRRLKLEEINRRSAVIRSFGGRCVVVTEGRSRHDANKKTYEYQSKESFEQWMANDFIPSLEKGKKAETVGPWWWRHPKRRQYDGVIFKPNAPAIVRTSDGQLLMNTYMGWGVEPKQGDWSLIRTHIRKVLANDDQKTDDYITRWVAWAIQHPDTRADVALVLMGEKGAGKGTLARVLEKIFGHHSFQASNLDHIVGKFNAHKENCILFVADEAYWGGHKSAQGELQRMITEPTLPIERKGFDIYEAPNYIHMMMLAEPGWVIPAGRFERRYAAFEVSEAYLGDFEYFTKLHDQIENGGAAAMLYDLQRIDLGKWHPREIYKTAALRHQQELSLSPLDEWMLGLLEDGTLPGTLAGRSRTANPTALINDARHKVPRLHDIGKNKFSDYLKRQWSCTTIGGHVRGYNFPPLAEMRSIWDKRFGVREWSEQDDWGMPVQQSLDEILNEKS
jgi:hypothetical protein